MRALGLDGLRAVSGQAVLNANYLRVLLGDHYDLPYDRPVLHEVATAARRPVLRWQPDATDGS